MRKYQFYQLSVIFVFIGHSVNSQTVQQDFLHENWNIFKKNKITKIYDATTLQPEEVPNYQLFYSIDTINQKAICHHPHMHQLFRYFSDTSYSITYITYPGANFAGKQYRNKDDSFNNESTAYQLKDTFFVEMKFKINKWHQKIKYERIVSDTAIDKIIHPNHYPPTDSLTLKYRSKITKVYDSTDQFNIKESIYNNGYFSDLYIYKFDSLLRPISEIHYEPPWNENAKTTSVVRAETYYKYHPGTNFLLEEKHTYYDIYRDDNSIQSSYINTYNEKGLIQSEIKNFHLKPKKQEITNYTYNYYENGLVKTMTRISTEWQTNIFNYKYE